MNPPATRAATVAALIGALLAGTGSACDSAPPTPPTSPAPSPTAPPPTGRVVSFVNGPPIESPTGIRLLTSGALLHIDATSTIPTNVNGWLRRPGHPALLLEEHRSDAEYGPLAVAPATATGLPGGPAVLRVTGPHIDTIGPSVDGSSVWVQEYATANACTLREIDRSGATRRRARPVPCGTRPVAETSHGLWVTVGPDAHAEATRVTTVLEYESVLLDPATLTERLRHRRVDLIDDHRYLVIHVEPGWPFELHDLRQASVTTVGRPPSSILSAPLVGELDPTGRYLPLTFGDPGTVPQVMDLWVLDLQTRAWIHPPRMPAYVALKGTSLTWAVDGRLVLLGQFARSARDLIGLLVTWQVGDTVLRVRPYERPSANDVRILSV